MGPEMTAVELTKGSLVDTQVVVSLCRTKVGRGPLAGGTPSEKDHDTEGGVRVGAGGGMPSENDPVITGGVRLAGGIPSENDQVMTGGVKVGGSLVLRTTVTVLCWVRVLLIVVVVVGSASPGAILRHQYSKTTAWEMMTYLGGAGTAGVPVERASVTVVVLVIVTSIVVVGLVVGSGQR